MEIRRTGGRLPGLLLALVLASLPPAAIAQAVTGFITFVESWPEETPLDIPGIPDAPDVWRDAMAGASRSIDIASFYFSRLGDGTDSYGPAGVADRLAPVLDEVVRAGGRGVTVRVLADAKFNQTYPDVPAWLGEQAGITARILDLEKAWGGGVLHAKYFLVDGDGFYIGSQNWDWRALGQIHELGVLVKEDGLARDLRRIYDLDWAIAGGEPWAGAEPADLPLADLPRRRLMTTQGAEVEALITASPRLGLPEGIPWDLPLMIELIDSARDSVHVQLLSFGETDREQRLFDDLDRALRRAAVRGASVRMILANWSKAKYNLPWIQALASIPGIEIRFTNVPEHSGGFIPFARVEHAKYLTVDGRAVWIGTSNWSRDYFHASRNVGLVLLGEGAPHDPDRFFNLSWHGPYAEPVEPCGDYSPPRRQ